jgi:putative lipoic acid-binding regulatory protein
VNAPETPAGGTPQLALLQFPTDYPLKVVGRTGGTLREQIDTIVSAHVPDLDSSRTTQRLSANGSYESISYFIRAVSAAQVTALVTDLKACPDVLMVI